MSRIFVTGGTGFVGGGLLDRLRVEPGVTEVRALARDRTKGETARGAGAEPVMGDVLEPATLREGMAGCDTVFHVAGRVAFCRRDQSVMFRVNVEGSVNVVLAAAQAGVRRLVYTSSAATLGEAAGTVGSEDSPHRGHYLSDYERSKHEAEQAVLEEAGRAGVDVVVVNPSSVQGPGRSTGTTRLLLGMVGARVMPVIDSRVSIVDIADCSEGHVLAWRHGQPGRRYVLNGSTTPVAEAVDLVRQVAGRAARPVFVPGALAGALGGAGGWLAQVLGRKPPICKEMMRVLRHGHSYDGSRATRELGLEYRPLRHTLERLIGWLVEYGFVTRPLPNFPKG